MNDSDKIFTSKCVDADVTKCWVGLCVAKDEVHALERFNYKRSSGLILINESVKFLSKFKDIEDQDIKNMITDKVIWYREINLVINKI